MRSLPCRIPADRNPAANRRELASNSARCASIPRAIRSAARICPAMYGGIAVLKINVRA